MNQTVKIMDIASSSVDLKPTAQLPVNTVEMQSTQAESDDELDELDDILDEFEEPVPAKAPVGNSSTSTSEAVDDEWARQLQAGMADLLSDINEDDTIQDQFATLAKELNDAMSSAGSQGRKNPANPNDDSTTSTKFQDTIKQALDRMKTSEEEIEAAVADTKDEDFLAEMLKQMQGTGGEEDFSGMLVGMMEQLTSKDILYEPMKELSEKYPEWIEKNQHTEPQQDMGRYREQYTIVADIVKKFEEPGYKDENEAHKEYIIDRMQKMQTAGAPPKELIGDVPSGLRMGDPEIGDCGVQ